MERTHRRVAATGQRAPRASLRRPLWHLAIQTSPEAEDAVAVLLADLFGLPTASWANLERQETTVSVWFPRKPVRWTVQRASLESGMRRIRACGLRVGPWRTTLMKVRRQDWAESWKRHFPPLEFGTALLVRPSWSRRLPRPGQALVELDPGLSFGTGQHPTTAFCLSQIVARRRPGFRQSLLDVGTGSGILAIAAAKLGYGPVEAIDVDLDALRIARANARRNGVNRRIRLAAADVAALPRRQPRRFGFVCANLAANLLLAERRRLVARLDSAGALVLAGILKTEFPAVKRAYEAEGLGLIADRTDGEWQSGVFCWDRSSRKI